MLTVECVILSLCPPYLELDWVSFLSKETHFFALSPVPLLLLSYESRCASRGAQPTFLVVNGKCPTKRAGLALKHRAKAAQVFTSCTSSSLERKEWFDG